MMSYKVFSTLIGLVLATTVALVGAIFFFQPDQIALVKMAAPIICLMVILTIVAVVERRKPLASFSKAERNMYTGSLLIGTAMLPMSLTLNLLEGFDVFGNSNTDRIWGAATGGVLMILGNLMPKALPPLATFKHAYKPVLSCMRFAGTGLFFAGGGFALAWLTLPIEDANRSAMIWCFVVICVVFVRTGVSLFNIAEIERAETPER